MDRASSPIPLSSSSGHAFGFYAATLPGLRPLHLRFAATALAFTRTPAGARSRRSTGQAREMVSDPASAGHVAESARLRELLYELLPVDYRRSKRYPTSANKLIVKKMRHCYHDPN